MGDNKTILFKLKDMELDKIQSFDVVSGSEGYVNGVIFDKNIISRIEVKKYPSTESSDTEDFFITLFMGNLKLGTLVAHEDHVLELYQCSLFPSFTIRKAGSFDYREV